MKALLSRLRYFLSDAWDECRHSPGVNLLATTTLAAALFVAGLVLLVLFNVGTRVGQLRDEVRVEIYLQDGIDEATRERIRERLAGTGGVARVEYVDKDEALHRFRLWSGDQADLIVELGTNPLPTSFEVYLSPGPEARDVARLIVAANTGKPGVEEARFDEEWLDRLEAAVGMARWGGVVLGLLVFSAVVFVMASVLRLAVYARRDEIDIMLLVGASPAFVRGPFLVAGAGQGIVASTVSLLLVAVARRFLLSQTSGDVGFLDLVALGLPLHFAVTLVAIGLAVGVAGAFFAVRTSI